jgi:hypothetical protein
VLPTSSTPVLATVAGTKERSEALGAPADVVDVEPLAEADAAVELLVDELLPPHALRVMPAISAAARAATDRRCGLDGLGLLMGIAALL